MALANDVGARIRKLREARKLTQDELGDKCGLSQSQINKLETGIQRFNAEQIESICEALGILPFTLFLDEVDNDIYEIMQSFNKTEKTHIVAILKEVKGGDIEAIRRALELIQRLKND